MSKERSKIGTKDCLHNPCLGCKKSRNNQQTNSSISKSSQKIKHEFDKSFKQNFQFTNHESLPSFIEFISYLKKAYPPQLVTSMADQIRAEEYYHLSISNRVYLDYIGHGLFSYSQVYKCHPNAAIASTSSSSSPPPPAAQFSEIPFFEIALNSTNLVSQLQNQEGQESEFELSMRKRIMKYMNMSEKDYSMVFTVNQVSAFRILSDSYPFDSTKKLLTMYDYKCEATEAMIQSSKKKGAHVISAEFLWPCLKINSKKLKKKMVSQKKKKRKGLFVFPLQSRVTGARYPYYWMNIAHENGWHSFLDADALGAKAMDTLGLSLFQPDFITCSFYKLFGDNPSGFSCLFVKKSCISVLDSSSITIGIVNLLPSKESTFSEPKIDQEEILEETGETQDAHQNVELKTNLDLEIDSTIESPLIDFLKSERKIEKKQKRINNKSNYKTIECRGLDHADTIGLILIRDRAKYQVNWLVNAFLSLHYPNSDNLAAPLVKIYGPKLRLDRGTSVAFNIFDWKKEKIDPALVQKLADRYNISVSCGFLQNICFSDKEMEYEQMLEMEEGIRKKKDKEIKKKGGKFVDHEISVITVSIDFLNNFEDLYRLWVFVARFLDADFLEKEKWKYMALNQTTVEI